MEIDFSSPVGHRIRYYRKKAGMTQKELADACGLTDPAIRNYELCNRIPSIETLSDIAAVLNVNLYTLQDPVVGPLGGAIQTLFRYEQAYQVEPVIDNGKVSLRIENCTAASPSYFEEMLRVWAKAYEMLKDGTWSQEEYQTWQSIYPYTTEENINHPLAQALRSALGQETEEALPTDSAPSVPEKLQNKRKRKPKKPE